MGFFSLSTNRHLLCAAAETPLGGPLDDAALFGESRAAFGEAVTALVAEEKLVPLPGGPHHAPSWRADVLNGTASELCNPRRGAVHSGRAAPGGSAV